MARNIMAKDEDKEVKPEVQEAPTQVISSDMVMIQLQQETNAILVEILKALQPLTTEVPKPESKD